MRGVQNAAQQQKKLNENKGSAAGRSRGNGGGGGGDGDGDGDGGTLAVGGGRTDGGDSGDDDSDGSGRAAGAQHARGQYMYAHVCGQASNMRGEGGREGERACNESSLTSCSGRGERGIEPRIGRADGHPAPSLLIVDATHRKHTTLNVLIMR